MKRSRLIFWLVILSLIIAGLLVFSYFWRFSKAQQAVSRKHQKESKGHQDLHFELVDPGQAFQSIRETVQLGYQIMLNTPENIKHYEGARISCTSCHFAGGNTSGGKNTGIPLAGVAAVYPKHNSRSGTVETLAQRINQCFERSLNSHPLPLESQEMIALVTYFQWISRGIAIYSKVPWLGMPLLKSSHTPNPAEGKKVYEIYCAMCHGKEGRGEVHNEIPPVWGLESFNDGAGMNAEPMLAAFIYRNMPYGDPGLTTAQALDVAAFIARQPRPKYQTQEE